MKTQIKLSAVMSTVLGIGCLLFAFTNTHVSAAPQNQLPAQLPASVPTTPVVVVSKIDPAASVPTISEVSVLDEKRQFALGMIETGNNDREIGGAGEISRYQIMPAIWHQYTDSHSYRNPDVSLDVARQLWSTLYTQFKQQAHREPTDFDMYVLWNTRYGYYASRSFKPAKLSHTVSERAQRFVNLVERGAI